MAVKNMASSSTRVVRAALDYLLRRSKRPELVKAVGRLVEDLADGLGFSSGPALLRYLDVFQTR